VAQVIKHLSSKHKALSSSPSTTKRKVKGEQTKSEGSRAETEGEGKRHVKGDNREKKGDCEHSTLNACVGMS
jgi:hypothetical protein